jgi:hypothetical protein
VATPTFNLTVMLTVGLTDEQTSSLPPRWARNHHQPHYIQVNDVDAPDAAAACQHVIDVLAPYIDECTKTADVDLDIRSIHVRRVDLPPLTSALPAEEPPPAGRSTPSGSRRTSARRGRR